MSMTMKEIDSLTNLWQAADHRFGVGKVHQRNPLDWDKTRCGLKVDRLGGRAGGGKMTCGGCINSAAADRKDEERLASYQLQAQERERAAEQERDKWFADYDAHLRSPKWARLRSLVMKRSGGMCEGCGTEEATQVHHLSYAHMGSELLWELVATCRTCHEMAHCKSK